MKWFVILPTAVSLIACQPVSVVDQAAFSRPIFQVNASGADALESGLSLQIETGRAASSNSTAGGCASCQ
jgi:hypothetical protein